MCPFTQTNKQANTHKHTGNHVFSVFGLVVLPPQPLPNWKIRLDILLALVPVQTGCRWWDLTRVGVEVVSLWMSRLRLKGSFPWKWAIKTEDLFIFLLSLFLVCIWHGVQKSGRLFGNDVGGRMERPQWKSSPWVKFHKWKCCLDYQVLLFIQQKKKGVWCLKCFWFSHSNWNV